MDRYTVRLQNRQSDVVESMAENGDAENPSEAIRDAIEHYAQSMGYVNGHKKSTFLTFAMWRVAWLFGIAGVVGLAFTLTYPVSARLPSFALVITSFACFGAYHALNYVEPKVTNSLRRIVRGEGA